MKQYYDLFPDKKYTFSEDIEEMFFGKNIQERCLKLLIPLIGTEGVRVTYDNLEIVNNIMVGYLIHLLIDNFFKQFFNDNIITYDDNGKAVRAVGSYKNITEKVKKRIKNIIYNSSDNTNYYKS